VRLAEIDAPEKSQPYGDLSRAHLANLIAGKYVSVRGHKVDRYGRIVGKVLFASQDICLKQVRAGLAWHYKQYPQEQDEHDRNAYVRAERIAKENRIGLWAEPIQRHHGSIGSRRKSCP
jgi:endonuclease YncB( thermonuclease family)